MEQTLVTHLLTISGRFASVRNLEESTVGKMCAADARFFSRLRDGKTFTIKKYDEVMAWFVRSWPEFVEWPAEVPRPELTDDIRGVAA